MARVTVEDCIENIPNRFELCAIAARRAKQIASGNPITIDRDNDKDSVVSLREIADETIDFEPLKEEIIESYCRNQRPDVIDGVDAPPQAPQISISDDSDDSFDVMDDAAFAEEFEAELEKVSKDMPEGMSFDDDDVNVND